MHNFILLKSHNLPIILVMANSHFTARNTLAASTGEMQHKPMGFFSAWKASSTVLTCSLTEQSLPGQPSYTGSWLLQSHLQNNVKIIGLLTEMLSWTVNGHSSRSSVLTREDDGIPDPLRWARRGPGYHPGQVWHSPQEHFSFPLLESLSSDLQHASDQCWCKYLHLWEG